MPDATPENPAATPSAVTEGYLSQMGRSATIVRCACGHKNTIYNRSWAGHGKARCKGCASFIAYGSLEVFPETKKIKTP